MIRDLESLWTRVQVCDSVHDQAALYIVLKSALLKPLLMCALKSGRSAVSALARGRGVNAPYEPAASTKWTCKTIVEPCTILFDMPSGQCEAVTV